MVGSLKTPWTEKVSLEHPWPDYPRPDMVRSDWQSLNGLWDYAIIGEDSEWPGGRVANAEADPLNQKGAAPPSEWDGRILVPFAVESALSGVQRYVRPHQTLWYRRRFQVPTTWRGSRLLLHFEAVDWHAVAWVDGKWVGEHKGGYTSFSFDITQALDERSEHELIVAVWDPTNAGDQAVGKQSLPEMRKGYRYTPTTGIWQTVWLEPVPETSIRRLKVVPNIDNNEVQISAELYGDPADTVLQYKVFANGALITESTSPAGQSARLRIENPLLWSPESPFLYDLKVEMAANGVIIDQVESYFGMRKVSVNKDNHGMPQIRLNDQPVFQFGPLDQGYWPDGILTPPCEEAIQFDLHYLKDIGCNMVRVHIKTHPKRWYYHCDRLGLLVWQDMVCTRKFEPKITPQSAEQWEHEQRQMIDQLHNHPSIIEWVVFNEAWGQYDTERITQWTMAYEPTRLVTGASGWHDHAVGHIFDSHDYSFHPSIPLPGQIRERAVVLGECGGFDVPMAGHLWHVNQEIASCSDPVVEQPRECYTSPEEWLERYENWIGSLNLFRIQGMNATVYTQITDVEHELNGWLTYDRAISKIDKSRLNDLHQRLYAPVPTGNHLLGSREEAVNWDYWIGSTPCDGWFDLNFTAEWMCGQAPFGNSKAEGLPVQEPWEQESIFLRKSFTLLERPSSVALFVTAFGVVEIYLNGTLIKKLSNHAQRTDHIYVTDILLTEKAIELLHPGENLISVRGFGTETRKFLEVSLVQLG